jgi:hypothetical protein
MAHKFTSAEEFQALFPEDLSWPTRDLNSQQRLAFEKDVARIASILRRKKRSAGSGRRSLWAPNKALEVPGHQPDWIGFAANILPSPRAESTKLTARVHCAFCGGPIDFPSTPVENRLLGLQIRDRWYHVSLCLDRVLNPYPKNRRLP